MKKLFFLLGLLIFNYQLYALTKTFPIDKDAIILRFYPGTNYGSNNRIVSDSWTASNSVTVIRSLIGIDLNQIPRGIIISQAKLYLYSPSPQPNDEYKHRSDLINSYYHSNSSYLRRITASWEENSVTWGSQPATTTSNQVVLQNSVSTSQNYVVDVTALLKDMIANKSTSFGFMMQLVTETQYARMCFASSDHSNSALHPKLEITYEYPATITEYLTGDSQICGYQTCSGGCKESNSGSYHLFKTGNDVNPIGTVMPHRSILFLDMSGYELLQISSAKLYLYGEGHVNAGKDNSAKIESYRILFDDCINENTVTWLKQPEVFYESVTIPSSTSASQNYVVDVTSFFNYNPAILPFTYAFRIRLVNESGKNSPAYLNFASKDNSDVTKRPKIVFTLSGVIQYPVFSKSTENSVESLQNTPASDSDVEIKPNPTSGMVDINLHGNISEKTELTIISLNGSFIDNKVLDSGFSQLDLSHLPKGVYFMSFNTGTTKITKKLVLE